MTVRLATISVAPARTPWSLIDEAHGLMSQAEERMTALRFMTDHLLAQREPDGLNDAIADARDEMEQFTHTAKLKLDKAMKLLSPVRE